MELVLKTSGMLSGEGFGTKNTETTPILVPAAIMKSTVDVTAMHVIAHAVFWNIQVITPGADLHMKNNNKRHSKLDYTSHRRR